MKEAQTNIDELLNDSPSITALTDRCEAIASVNMTVVTVVPDPILDKTIDTSNEMLLTPVPEIIAENKPVPDTVTLKSDPDTTKQSGATALSTDTISRKVLRTVGKTAVHVITSSLARKAAVAGALYFSGATLASVVGLAPLVAVSAVAWFL